MNPSHPLGVTLCQVVVYSDNMHALACQSIQIGRRGGNQRFSFTGSHLRDTALVKDDAADELHPVMFHI